MCRHVLDTGERCARRRDEGSRYCWQHRALYGDAVQPEAVPTTVTPEFLATVIRDTEVPVSYRRQFAVEFCEMFRDRNPNFDTAYFMALVGG